MVLSTVDKDKAQCLLLGHWPRAAKGKGKASSPSTAWFKHIVQAMQHVANAIAPLGPIYSVLVQQGTNGAFGPSARFAQTVCAIRIQDGRVQLQRRTGETWTTVIQSKCDTGHRSILVTAVLSTPDLPVQNRGKKKLDLKNILQLYRQTCMFVYPCHLKEITIVLNQISFFLKYLE